MTSTLSVMSLEAKKLRIGKYTMWFNDNAIYCSDSEKTWVLHLSEGTEITPYDPTTSMNILPYIKTDIMDYKNQTVFNALYEGLSYVLQNIKDINELKNGMADIAYIREDLNNNFNFGDNLEIKKDILIDNKTITGIAGTLPWLAENVQLMTLEYYEAHKDELKGEKGDKGDKGDDGDDASGAGSFFMDLLGFGVDAAEIYGAVQAIGVLEGQIAGLQGQIMALGLDNITDDMMDGLNDALDELNEVGDDMEDDSQSNAITRLTAAIKKIQATLRDHEQRLSKAENDIQGHEDALRDHKDKIDENKNRLDQYKDRLDQINTILQKIGDFLWLMIEWLGVNLHFEFDDNDGPDDGDDGDDPDEGNDPAAYKIKSALKKVLVKLFRLDRQFIDDTQAAADQAAQDNQQLQQEVQELTQQIQHDISQLEFEEEEEEPEPEPEPEPEKQPERPMIHLTHHSKGIFSSIMRRHKQEEKARSVLNQSLMDDAEMCDRAHQVIKSTRKKKGYELFSSDGIELEDLNGDGVKDKPLDEHYAPPKPDPEAPDIEDPDPNPEEEGELEDLDSPPPIADVKQPGIIRRATGSLFNGLVFTVKAAKNAFMCQADANDVIENELENEETRAGEINGRITQHVEVMRRDENNVPQPVNPPPALEITPRRWNPTVNFCQKQSERLQYRVNLFLKHHDWDLQNNHNIHKDIVLSAMEFCQVNDVLSHRWSEAYGDPFWFEDFPKDKAIPQRRFGPNGEISYFDYTPALTLEDFPAVPEEQPSFVRDVLRRTTGGILNFMNSVANMGIVHRDITVYEENKRLQDELNKKVLFYDDMRSHAQPLYWQLNSNIADINRLMMYQTDGRIDMVNERQLNIYVNWLKQWLNDTINRKDIWFDAQNMDWPAPPPFPFNEFFAAGEDMSIPWARDTQLLPPWSSPAMNDVHPYFITRPLPPLQEAYREYETQYNPFWNPVWDDLEDDYNPFAVPSYGTETEEPEPEPEPQPQPTTRSVKTDMPGVKRRNIGPITYHIFATAIDFNQWLNKQYPYFHEIMDSVRQVIYGNNMLLSAEQYEAFASQIFRAEIYERIRNFNIDIDTSDLATKEDLSTKADINHSHSEYALTTHTHSQYALTNHTHSGYALTDHTHSEYATKEELNNKADTDHTHSEYATKEELNNKVDVEGTKQIIIKGPGFYDECYLSTSQLRIESEDSYYRQYTTQWELMTHDTDTTTLSSFSRGILSSRFLGDGEKVYQLGGDGLSIEHVDSNKSAKYYVDGVKINDEKASWTRAELEEITKDHNHDDRYPLREQLSFKADIEHTHSQYALKEHTHSFEEITDSPITVSKDSYGITAMNLQCNLLKVNGVNIGDLIHPVGSIYISVNSTNPSLLFGGIWEQIVDRFLYCADSSGATGGSKKISVANLPAHNHTLAIIKTIDEASNYGLRWGETGFFNRVMVSSPTDSPAKQTSTRNTGSGTDYMPPYMTVYAWQRTA